MRSAKRPLQKRPTLPRVGPDAPERDLLGRVFLVYLAVTGTAFLILLAEPEAAHSAALQSFADLAGRVFAVVENSGDCTARPQSRRLFVAIVVVALHIMVPAITLVPAWRRRRADDQPLRRPRLREMLELLGAPPLFVGLYWYTFFATAGGEGGTGPADGSVCGHLASVWLMFTVQGTIAIAFVCVLIAATGSLLFRLWKRIPRPKG